MGAGTNELKHALTIIEIAGITSVDLPEGERLNLIRSKAAESLGEAIKTVKKLLPRDPMRIESEGGVKIHPECALVVDGQEQGDFVVGAFGVEYASFMPPIPGSGDPHFHVCSPQPIVQVFVESKAFATIKEEIRGS